MNDDANRNPRFADFERWWLIAEKIHLDSPFFHGDLIVEDVEETDHTITYKLVSVPKW